MTATDRSDEELHQEAVQGDAEAQEELKSRLLPSLFDLSVRISLDPYVASAATEATLTRIAAEPRPPIGLSLRAWSMASVRDETLERLRTRGNPDDARAPLSPVDRDFSALPADTTVDPELAGWAWQAARSQRPRDYSLLDLSVRRGLSADEIADATDMSHSGIYAILGRLRGLFEETFTSTLLFNRGLEACADLAGQVRGHTLGPALRREIARHVEGCGACRQTRRAFASPADLLAAFEPVPSLPPAAPPIAPEAIDETALEPEAQPALPLTGAAALAAASEALDQVEEAEMAPFAPAEDLDATIAAEVPLPPIEPQAEPEAHAEPEALPAPSAEDLQPAPVATVEMPAAADLDAREGEARDEPEPVPVGAATASVRTSTEERIRFQRDQYLRGVGADGPPDGPLSRLRGWFDEQGPARVSLTVLFIGAVFLAVYLGLALGDSIEGGDGGSSGGGLAALPTGTPGIKQITCGSGTYTIDQGTPYTLTFDSSALPGFQVSKISVLPVSAGAVAQSIDAKTVQPLTVEVQALRLPSSAGRTDEYRLMVTFSKTGERDVTSECTILARGLAATNTPAASPSASPSASPTSTQTRPPSTAIAATQTPVPATPTSSSTAAPTTPSPAATSSVSPTVTPTRTSTPNP